MRFGLKVGEHVRCEVVTGVRVSLYHQKAKRRGGLGGKVDNCCASPEISGYPGLESGLHVFSKEYSSTVGVDHGNPDPFWALARWYRGLENDWLWGM